MPIYDQSCSLSDTSYENNFDTKKNVFWVKGVESWEIRIPAITPHGSIKVTSVFTFQLLFRASLKVKIAEIPPKLVYLRQKISPVFSVLQIVTKNNHSNFGVPSHEQFRKVSKPKCLGSRWNHPGHKPVGVRGARDLHDITVPTQWAKFGSTWLVQRTNFSKIPYILTAKEGHKLGRPTRFYAMDKTVHRPKSTKVFAAVTNKRMLPTLVLSAPAMALQATPEIAFMADLAQTHVIWWPSQWL